MNQMVWVLVVFRSMPVLWLPVRYPSHRWATSGRITFTRTWRICPSIQRMQRALAIFWVRYIAWKSLSKLKATNRRWHHHEIFLQKMFLWDFGSFPRNMKRFRCLCVWKTATAERPEIGLSIIMWQQLRWGWEKRDAARNQPSKI